MEKKDWLLKAEIFASLDKRGLELISGYSDFISYHSGEEVFAEGGESGGVRGESVQLRHFREAAIRQSAFCHCN